MIRILIIWVYFLLVVLLRIGRGNTNIVWLLLILRDLLRIILYLFFRFVYQGVSQRYKSTFHSVACFCRSLKHSQTSSFCEFMDIVFRNFPLWNRNTALTRIGGRLRLLSLNDIVLISHDYNLHISLCILVDLFEPIIKILKGFFFKEVKHKDDAI